MSEKEKEKEQEKEPEKKPKEKEGLFRQKSLEQFTAPEQLNDYIRVSRPSIILIMVAIISFLAGVIIWGYLGSIDSHANAIATSSEGVITTYLRTSDATELNLRSVVQIGEKEYNITSISDPYIAGEILEPEQMMRYCVSANDQVYGITADGGTLTDGLYTAKVIMARIRPIDLILG